MSTDFLSKSLKSRERDGSKPVVNEPVETPTGYALKALEVGAIDPDPNQPRSNWSNEDIELLAASISETEGCIQPITVRPNPEKIGRYILIYGEGRWRSHKFLNMRNILALVPESEMDLGHVFSIQTIENMTQTLMTREDEARAVVYSLDELKLDRKQVKSRYKLTDAQISRLVKFHSCSQRTKDQLKNVRNINILANVVTLETLLDEKELSKVIEKIANKELNEKKVSELVKRLKEPAPQKTPKAEHQMMLEEGQDPFKTVVESISQGELDTDEMEFAEQALRESCSNHNLETPLSLLDKEWTPETLKSDTLIDALVDEQAKKETPPEKPIDTDRTIVTVDGFDINNDGSLLLYQGDKTTVIVSKALLTKILKSAKAKK